MKSILKSSTTIVVLFLLFSSGVDAKEVNAKKSAPSASGTLFTNTKSDYSITLPGCFKPEDSEDDKHDPTKASDVIANRAEGCADPLFGEITYIGIETGSGNGKGFWNLPNGGFYEGYYAVSKADIPQANSWVLTRDRKDMGPTKVGTVTVWNFRIPCPHNSIYLFMTIKRDDVLSERMKKTKIVEVPSSIKKIADSFRCKD
jgi:hypothetical protein